MKHSTVRAKVYRDNTGIATEIPVILTEDGPLYPLVDYFLERAHVRSAIWMVKVAQGISLLLDYMASNRDYFADVQELFGTFVQRLYTGTVGEDGSDPSGLYWQGKRLAVVRQLTSLVSEFSDWMAARSGAIPLNPWRQATRSEEMLAWAAWHHRNNRAFLAHTFDRNRPSLTVSHARRVLLERTPVIDHDAVKAFSEDHIGDLLFSGFAVPGKRNSPRLEERINLRDVLITLLMHYGGLRMSEPFHLYVHDVIPDPIYPNRAFVRIFHPGLGTAPSDWLGLNGKARRIDREGYLRGKYGMRPRNMYAVTCQLHAGWKGNALDSKDHFIDVHWFPQWAGEVFLKLWILYMAQRTQKRCDHPFAFVTAAGSPYAIDSFERQYRRAIERIGLTPAKALGTTPHAHRHAYGQRLADADVDPLVRKKALHHKSIESQLVYTSPDRNRINKLLGEALGRLESGNTLAAPDLSRYGFVDVDPIGLFSGAHPKLRRH